jgi:hypothetical protein
MKGKIIIMKRFKAHILAAVGLLILAAVIAAMTPKRVLAALGYTPVFDISNPALQPFSHEFHISFPNGSVGTDTFTVPAGKRLVIETVTGAAFLSPGVNVDFAMDVALNGAFVRYNFQSASAGVFFNLERHHTAHAVRIYADPGTTIRAIVQKSNSSTAGGGNISIAGHFVNLP